MATGSIPAMISRESVGRAIALARIECKDDKRWLNAVNRAALNLEACAWQFNGDVLMIKSASEDVEYTVTERMCECKAYIGGKPCWHRAAVRLLMKAAEIAHIPIPKETCPMCGQEVEGRPYSSCGKNYVYFPICDGDGNHEIRIESNGGDDA